jgi:hypothetical protein
MQAISFAAMLITTKRHHTNYLASTPENKSKRECPGLPGDALDSLYNCNDPEERQKYSISSK